MLADVRAGDAIITSVIGRRVRGWIVASPGGLGEGPFPLKGPPGCIVTEVLAQQARFDRASYVAAITGVLVSVVTLFVANPAKTVATLRFVACVEAFVRIVHVSVIARFSRLDLAVAAFG
jgi:hypothetical protein